jgi:hypothetical protein
VLFAILLAWYPQLTSAGCCINYIKKSLTAMYLPDKSKGEKEGALYKEIQQMVLEKAEEINVIWEYVFGRSLLGCSLDEIKMIAHRQGDPGHEVSERSLASEPSIQDHTQVTVSTANFGTKIIGSTMDESGHVDRFQNTFGFNSDFSINESFSNNALRPDCLMYDKTLVGEMPLSTNFKKNAPPKETTSYDEPVDTSSFAQILRNHVEVSVLD